MEIDSEEVLVGGSIRERVIKGALTAQVGVQVLCDQQIEAVVELVEEAVLTGVDNPLNYAFVCGRNEAIDTLRCIRSLKRKMAAATLRRVERLASLREEKRREELRVEFNGLREAVLQNVLPRHAQGVSRQLDVAFDVIFNGASDEDILGVYPDSSRDQRYQWKKRGVDRVWPLASSELQTLLSEKTWQRRQ